MAYSFRAIPGTVLGIAPLRICAVWLCFVLPWLGLWWAWRDLGGWPLNDDPFYAKPVEFWSRDGSWQFVRQYGALTASSVAHIRLGALATAAQPFEYRTLYLVCIVQQAIGAAALYWAARQWSLSHSFAWLNALSLLCFPLYFGHGFTFMTDGPATAWAAVACAGAAVGILRNDWRWVAVGALAVGYGYWIRQTNGLLLIGLLSSLGLGWLQLKASGRKFSSRCRDAEGSLPAGNTLVASEPPRHQAPSHAADAVSPRVGWLHVAVIFLFAGIPCGLLESGWLIPSSVSRVPDVSPMHDEGYIKRTMIAAYGWLLLSGWYSLPWLPLLIGSAIRVSRTMSMPMKYLCGSSALIVLLGSLAPFFFTHGRAHLTSATGAFIQNGHFGPIFLSDMDEPGRWGDLGGVVWPAPLWQALSLLSLLSTAAVAWWAVWTACCWQRTWNQRSPDRRSSVALGFLSMIAVSVLAVLVMVEPHMDRYWLFLMPALSVWWLLLAALCRWKLTRISVCWAVLWLGLNMGMGVVFSHDMLAWNNVRWRYVHQQLAAGIPADSMDAGRDVNAWLRMEEDPNTSARPGDSSRWWSGKATQSIAVGPRPGWRLQRRLPWQSWATGRTHFLLVLERELQTRSPGDPILAQGTSQP